MKPETMSWANFVPSLFGLLGVLLGSGVTLWTTGTMEREKVVQTTSVGSYISFIEASWVIDGGDAVENVKAMRKRSSVAVFAPPEVLRNYVEYRKCGGSRRPKCRAYYAKVISEIRKATNQRAIDEDLIIDMIWLPPKSPE